jgi:hypothetical protein
MHVETALRTVEREHLKLALEVGLHVQELEAEHLRVDGDRMIASTCSLRFVNELVGLDGLLGDDTDGVLEDVTFSASHCRDASPRVCRQMGEAPQRAAAAGLPWTRHQEGGVQPRSYGGWSPNGISGLTDPLSI